MNNPVENPRWKWGSRFFYPYLGFLLVASYIISDGTSNRAIPDHLFWFVVPLTGYLTVYSLCTGKAPARFKEVKRAENPRLFWLTVAAFCMITALIALKAIGIDFITF